MNKLSKIVFWGGPKFSIPSFETLIKNGYELTVVTTPDKSAGKKKAITLPPLKQVSQKYKLSCLQPEKLKNNQELVNELKKFNPDLFVIAAYGKIIPKEYLDIPKFGSLNIHPSLLPKYRGPTPVRTAILNSETETGVTIMLMDEAIDHGPIIKKLALPSSRAQAEGSEVEGSKLQIKSQNYLELYEELAQLGAKLLIETIPDWVGGKLKARPQDHQKATYTKKFTFEDGKIDWSKSAEEIDRLIRALNPEPGTWTRWKGKVLKISEAEIIKDLKTEKPGLVTQSNSKIIIHTCKDVITPKILQLEGKKSVTAQEFINGHRNFIGSTLG